MNITKEMMEYYAEWSKTRLEDSLTHLKNSGLKSAHSAKWHAMRSVTIGGSDVGAIAGLNKYSTALQCFNSKTMRAMPFSGNFATRLGACEEDFIANELKYTLSDVKILGGTSYVDKAHPWRAAQIDNQALVNGEKCNIECKTAAFAVGEWGQPCTILEGQIVEESDLVPQSYIAQCLYGLALANIQEPNSVKYCLLLAHIGAERELRVYKINRNPELEEMLLNIADDFIFNHLMPDVPPKATNQEVAAQFKSAKSATKAEIVIQNGENLAVKMLHLKQKIDALQEQYSDLEDKLKAEMKENEIAKDSAGHILATWKSSTSKRFDSTKFKKEQTELYNQYLKEGISRRFLFKFNELTA